MTMTEPWLPEELWQRTIIAPWKVRILRLIFPGRWWVQIRGKVYILRMPVE